MTQNEFRIAINYLVKTSYFDENVTLFIAADQQRAINDETGENLTPDQATLDQALLDARDAAQEQREDELIQEGAEDQVAAIPNWAGWTEQQATGWIDENVTDLASAKQALRAMARLLVALRNERWPNLQE